ncbi:hypothetical protein LX64_00334 [Chitinophaga skermanii]|uniref:Protein glutaminase domain-containing protein n=2 Tax=Chitinophaga skermanii TaxID=331697 RepID=A0A327R3U9_9BACT|nr:hypothetical protein LX64_00334 [Chitinophaga skermanii]
MLFSCLLMMSKVTGQFYLPIEENHLLNCCNPTNTPIARYTTAQIDGAYRYLLDTLKFEYRYIHGACENRAHFMSTALQKKGIQTQKIWCFAPARYTFLSKKQLFVKDPLQITDTVNWTYHVAPIIISDKNDTLVIDPSLLSTGPVPYKQWLNALNCPEAMYTFIDSEWYLFNSFNGFKVYNNVNDANPRTLDIPAWFPNVMTGDFMNYSMGTQNIPNGLATNDIAMKIYVDEKTTLSKEDFQKILGNINNVIAFITNTTNNTIDQSFKDKHAVLVKKYEAAFNERKKYWSEVYNRLSN